MNLFTYWIEDSLMSQAPHSPSILNPSSEAILARVDERTRSMSDNIADLKKGLEVVRSDVERGQAATRKELEEFRAEVDKKLDGHDGKYVTKDRFALIEKLVLSFAGLILLSVAVALIALVVNAGNAPGVTP